MTVFLFFSDRREIFFRDWPLKATRFDIYRVFVMARCVVFGFGREALGKAIILHSQALYEEKSGLFAPCSV